ncbi:hypothetical protein JNB62_03170 [Microbacterium jejuense]|uniref:Uncharacterized protein n=1 Tax=Microbacterium jejuense TaxID=1263637 RepID=A0ABS7HLC6_9MICO|nr:hypothetical protein [Microbacterium jejuense]MBW9092678.1 hypothetical protein [Microbacterium jejuense]
MFFGLDGWFFVLFIYGGLLAIIAAALYVVVRLGVLHGLKAHTRWVDRGKP